MHTGSLPDVNALLRKTKLEFRYREFFAVYISNECGTVIPTLSLTFPLACIVSSRYSNWNRKLRSRGSFLSNWLRCRSICSRTATKLRPDCFQDRVPVCFSCIYRGMQDNQSLVQRIVEWRAGPMLATTIQYYKLSYTPYKEHCYASMKCGHIVQCFIVFLCWILVGGVCEARLTSV